MSTFHAQSVKETYNSDIEDSIKHKEIYKMFEFFDDYSYGNSGKMGFYIKLDLERNKKYLIFFMEDGPQSPEKMQKILEWRRSGISNEIGHKGGGNKRNIYGHKSEKTCLYSKLENGRIIWSETYPNKLYDLANSDISEDEFRSRSDSSEYVMVPSLKDEEDLPSWCSLQYQELNELFYMQANYFIRMELSELPREYNNIDKWTELINQIGAKQYQIPIFYKNDLLDKKGEIVNIDLVGFETKNDEKTLQLFVDTETYKFYIKNQNKYFDAETKVLQEDKDTFILWGEINMFISGEEEFSSNLKKYNTDINNKHKAEDFYGVYILLNNKLTNYLPIAGKLLGDGKSNRIINGEKNCNRFRMIFIPNQDHCSKDLFNSLIRTESIKALTGFLDKSCYREIIKNSMEFYKGKPDKNGESVFISESDYIAPVPKPKLGGGFLLYYGSGLWKFGFTTTFNSIEKIVKKEYEKSIELINHYINLEQEIKLALLFWKSKPTENLEELENKIFDIIEEYSENEEDLILNIEVERDLEKYFICEDIQHIIDYFIPTLNSI